MYSFVQVEVGEGEVWYWYSGVKNSLQFVPALNRKESGSL